MINNGNVTVKVIECGNKNIKGGKYDRKRNSHKKIHVSKNVWS